MKNLLLLICWCLVFSVQAQIKGFVGLKGGAQLSSAYIEHTIYQYNNNILPKPGFHTGLAGKIFTNKQDDGLNAGLQVSALYMQKGWTQSFPGTTEEPYTCDLNYLEIPLEAVIYGGRGRVKLFFTLGMYLEYLLSVEKDPDPENIDFWNFFTYEEGRDLKLGYGGRASAGLWYDTPVGTFQLEGFITFSISSFLDYDSLDSGLPDLTNNYVGGISVSYLIPFGKMEF